MSLSHVNRLSRAIAHSDAQDLEQQGRLREQLHELRRLVRGEELAGGEGVEATLEVAAQLADYLARGTGPSVEELTALVSSLMTSVEGAVSTAECLRTRACRDGTAPQDIFASEALGEILLQMDVLSEDDLDHALELQRDTGGRLGERLLELELVSPEYLDLALRTQAEIQRSFARSAEARPEEGIGGEETGASAQENALIGRILLHMGTISEEQLEEALQRNAASGMPTGEALVKIGAADWRAVRAARRLQEKMRKSLPWRAGS